MDFSNFVEVTSTFNKNTNNIYFTLGSDHITFSRAAVAALNVPYVKIFANHDSKEILITDSTEDEGIRFVNPAKKTRNVVWCKKYVRDLVKSMINKSGHFRVAGEVVDNDGTKCLLFHCDKVSPMR